MKSELREFRSQKLEAGSEGFLTVFGFCGSLWILELGIWIF
jgi:hypothetical protein